MPCLAPERTYDEERRVSDWYDEETERPSFYILHARTPRSNRTNGTPTLRSSLRHSDILRDYLAIREAVQRSKSLTNLVDDWDDEGAAGYHHLTWRRAVDFVLAQAKASRDSGLAAGVPRISPADQGSIDIYWRNAASDLLINIPADLARSATYYGTNSRGETVSGLLDTGSSRLDLLLWLTK